MPPLTRVELTLCAFEFAVADQSGKVLIKSLADIGAGHTSYIDYNDDRILFYPRVHSPDFSAVVRRRSHRCHAHIYIQLTNSHDGLIIQFLRKHRQCVLHILAITDLIPLVAIIPSGGDFHALHAQQVGTNSWTQVTWS